MKVPLDWLKEFIHLDDLDLHSLTELMTVRGLEVDAFDATLLEVSQTPDLGYTRSILGTARYLHQLLDRPVKKPHFHTIQETLAAPIAYMDAHAEEFVPKYCLRRIENIQNGPSPRWMQERLKLAGMTPKNLIVDVTNYVQMALGQPMHAFDADKIASPLTITVTQEPTPFTTLSDIPLELAPQTLVIRTIERLEAVAGIIGGKESSVTENTQNILLESALFSSTKIRRTSKGMRFSTPSSQRFENMIDPEMVEFALDYATALLMEHGQATASKPLHLKTHSLEEKTATLSLERVESLLGIQTSIAELQQVMEKIDVQVTNSTSMQLFVTLPHYRTDLSEEIDLIEEVIKILGFERLNAPNATIPLTHIAPDPIVDFRQLVRQKLLEQGLTEWMTPSLIDKEHLLSPETSIEVKNALSDRSVLRTTHLYGSLESALHNQNHHCFTLQGFEIGTVYHKGANGFHEQTVLSITLEGEETDFFILKGMFETLCTQLHITKMTTIPSHLPHLHPHRQALFEVDGETLGAIGELHPALLKKFGIKKRLYFGEISLERLMHHTPRTFHIAPISNFPGIERDTTFTLKRSISYAFLQSLIETHRPVLLQNYHFKGVYDPDKNGPTHNLTMRWVYRSHERSLTQDEVEKSLQEFLTKLHHEINS